MISDPQFMQIAKEASAQLATTFVKEGMLIGLGTGSTAFFFIKELAKRCQEGLKIQAIASSQRSKKLAEELGIPLLDAETVSSLDLTVDGADQIDIKKRMIKGGGGALLREKIVASMSQEMVVIVDENKLVDHLGCCKLPIEIVPFGFKATIKHLQNLGYQGEIRSHTPQNLYLTDNKNFIYDIFIDKLPNPELDEAKIRHIPGVVETGFFLNIAGRVVVGYNNGKTEVHK
jgi:ribose 5-phosphate isomerase A